MSSDYLLQRVIQQYLNRDQLIQEGIWEGKLYKIQSNSNDGTPSSYVSFDTLTRGWIWKTLVLNVVENDAGFSNAGYFNDSGLLPVPILSSSSNQNIQNNNNNNNNNNNSGSTTTTGHAHKRMNSLELPFKKLSRGIRKLTPHETYVHPLRQSMNHHYKDSLNNNNNNNNKGNQEEEEEESDSLTLQDTLEIIDLDLSRLIIDDIFMDPVVHAEMRQIMFNYLVRLSLQRERNSNNGHRVSNSTEVSSNMKFDHLNLLRLRYHYKQGFHELLGLIFLQMYDPTSTNKESYMKNTLYIFEKLMNQIESIFYNETNLIHWEETIFSKMLQICSLRIYNLFYNQFTNTITTGDHNNVKNRHSNMIWLIRWTRLLFLRELPIEKVYIIWDHLLTFRFPIKTFMASLIVIIILHLNDVLFSRSGIDRLENIDNDDLIEIMLHAKDQPCIINLDPVKVCQLAGSLTQMWYLQNFDNVKSLIIDKIIPGNSSDIDPYRQRMEAKLRQRVQQSLK